MKAVCVVGASDSEKTAFVESLVSALSERGSVATVKSVSGRHETDADEKGEGRYRQAGAERIVCVAPETETRFEVAETDEKQISEVLDSLTDAGYDYTVVEGFSCTTLPKIAVGDTDAENVVLREASDASAEELIEAVEGVEDRETLGSLVRRVKESDDSPKAGAVSTFTGRVREENVEGARTTRLEYEKYEEVADERVEEIRADLEERDGVYAVEMYHETGVVPAEEDAVHVVVLAGHREEAFRAVEDGIDRLKDEVPIFKKEVTEEGSFWSHDGP